MSPASDSALNAVIPIEEVRALVENTWLWISENLLTIGVGAQLIAIFAALVPAVLFGPRLKRLLDQQVLARVPKGFLRSLVQAAGTLAIPIALYLCLTILRIGFGSAAAGTAWIGAAIALLNAWIVVRLVTLVIQSPFWSRLAFYIAWPIAALDAFGALAPVVAELQALAIPLGEDQDGNQIQFTVLDVFRTLMYFGFLFWGANLLSKLAQQQLAKIDELSPSLKALIGKLLNVILPIIALLIALQIVGFNLATLAVFSGAVGLGIGLGLQNVVANFVAGFTLIADKSIKPHDTIEIDGIMGWVTSMQARYVALRTRDGKELLVPNARFMSEGLTNWSRSDRVIRLHAPFSVSYKVRDLKGIQKLIIEAVLDIPRIVSWPEPVCNVEGFGDSAVNFNVCYWIQDPCNGLSNIKSDVLLEIWQVLHDNDIEIPFPQQDLHIKSWPAKAGDSQDIS